MILAALQADAAAAGGIDWTVSVDSTVSRAHQHTAGARRGSQRQKEPPGGSLAGLAKHQNPSGLRAGPPTAGHRDHRRAARRQPAVHPGPAQDPRKAGRRWPAAQPPAAGPRRQGVHQQSQPCSPACSPVCSGIKACIPPKTGQDAHRKAKGSKAVGHPPSTGPLPPAPRRRMRHQQAQTAPRHGRQIRQTRRALRSHRHHRRNQPMAMTLTKQGLAVAGPSQRSRVHRPDEAAPPRLRGAK